MAVNREQVVQWVNESELDINLDWSERNLINFATLARADLEATIAEQAKEIEGLKTTLKGPDRHDLQSNGKHPSPCAKFCEATAFWIDERRLRQQLKASLAREAQLREALDYIDSDNASEEVLRRASQALAIPSDDSALRERDQRTIAEFLERSGKWMTNDAMLAERDKRVVEACCKVVDDHYDECEPLLDSDMMRNEWESYMITTSDQQAKTP